MAENELKPCQCGSDVELCRGDDYYWEKRQNKFKQERDKVLLTFDLEKIKRFYKKYRDLLIFPYLPPDDIIYRDSMEDILLMDKATKRQKKRAKTWLEKYRRADNGRE